MPDTYKIGGGFSDEWHSKLWDYLRPPLQDPLWGSYTSQMPTGHYPDDVPPPAGGSVSLPPTTVSEFSGVIVVTEDDPHIFVQSPSTVIIGLLSSIGVTSTPSVSSGTFVAEPPGDNVFIVPTQSYGLVEVSFTTGLFGEAPPEVTLPDTEAVATTGTTQDTDFVVVAPPEVSISTPETEVDSPGVSSGTFTAFPPVDINLSGPYAITQEPVVTSGFIYVEDISGNVTLEPELVDISGAGWSGASAYAADEPEGSSYGVGLSYASATVSEHGAGPTELESAPSLYRRLWQIVHRMKLRDRDQ